MTDGKVSYDEYLAGYRRYAACTAKAGYKVTNRGEIGRVIQYSVPSEGLTASDKCYAQEFQEIDTSWQIANEDQSYEAQVLRTCLTQHGVTPAQSLDAMAAQLHELKVNIDTCESVNPVP
jgi:hypothetical protein